MRDQLLVGDFGDNLKLLQTYPLDINIEDIIELAVRMRADPNFVVPETVVLKPTEEEEQQ